MQVTSFNNNAEFSQVGDVTFTTKSGTNQYHGSLFEYFQNNALDANPYGFSGKAPETLQYVWRIARRSGNIPISTTARTKRNGTTSTTKGTAARPPLPSSSSFPRRPNVTAT